MKFMTETELSEWRKGLRGAHTIWVWEGDVCHRPWLRDVNVVDVHYFFGGHYGQTDMVYPAFEDANAARVEALLDLLKDAAPNMIVSEIQPIETAPIDGTWILVNVGPFAGWWPVHCNEFGLWDDDRATYDSVTHWMPMPELPGEAE